MGRHPFTAAGRTGSGGGLSRIPRITPRLYAAVPRNSQGGQSPPLAPGTRRGPGINPKTQSLDPASAPRGPRQPDVGDPTRRGTVADPDVFEPSDGCGPTSRRARPSPLRLQPWYHVTKEGLRTRPTDLCPARTRLRSASTVIYASSPGSRRPSGWRGGPASAPAASRPAPASGTGRTHGSARYRPRNSLASGVSSR
jgi:hypothetical protein